MERKVLCGLWWLWSAEKFWNGSQWDRRGRGGGGRRKSRKTASHHPRLRFGDVVGQFDQDRIRNFVSTSVKKMERRSEVQCKSHLKTLCSKWSWDLQWKSLPLVVLSVSSHFPLYFLHPFPSCLTLCLFTTNSPLRDNQQNPQNSEVFFMSPWVTALFLRAEKNVYSSLVQSLPFVNEETEAQRGGVTAQRGKDHIASQWYNYDRPMSLAYSLSLCLLY